MNADIKKALILRMARGMSRGYFKLTPPYRPHEKWLITLAGYAFSALEHCEEGRVVIRRAAEQLNLLEYEDQPLLFPLP